MATDANLLAQLAEAIVDDSIKVVDLTKTLSPKTPVIQLPEEFAASPPFSMELISRYDERGPAWYWNWFKCGEHTGTHFDAPIHWVTGKDYENHATDSIDVKRFIGPAFVIDAAREATADNDFLLTVDYIKAWEGKHGQIQPESWVLIRTDWSNRDDPDDYLNIHEDGAHTPGFHPGAVPFLADKGILGIGVETVGTDAGQAPMLDPQFPCHTLMHGANKFGLASLTNLDQLPATGAVVIAPPLKIINGSGSPLRVLALVPGS